MPVIYSCDLPDNTARFRGTSTKEECDLSWKIIICQDCQGQVLFLFGPYHFATQRPRTRRGAGTPREYAVRPGCSI
jgi:hypothetical protein